MTIFGVADAAITQFSATGAGNAVRLQGEGRNESTRLGFRGMEDMGGGLAAAFWLEAAYNQDNGTGSTSTSNNTATGQNSSVSATGTSGNTSGNLIGSSAGGQQGLTFNRAANVSLLSKQLGELRVGRDYNPAFWNLTYFDPFGTVGAGAATNVYFGSLTPAGRSAVSPPGNPSPQVRTSNSIGWLSPDYNGFRYQAQLGLSEQFSTCADAYSSGTGPNGNLCVGAAGDGKNIAHRLSYASGPLTAALAYSTTYYNNSTPRNSTATVGASTGNTAQSIVPFNGNYTHMNLGVAYDTGPAKLSYVYSSQTYGDQLYNVAAGTTTQTQAGLNAVNNLSVLTSGALGAIQAAGTVSVTAVKLNTNFFGVSVPMGNWTWKASYAAATRTGGVTSTTQATYQYYDIADSTKQTQYALGFVYDFSKRTAVYGTYAAQNVTGVNANADNGMKSVVNGTAGASVSATGLDLGIRHRF